MIGLSLPIIRPCRQTFDDELSSSGQNLHHRSKLNPMRIILLLLIIPMFSLGASALGVESSHQDSLESLQKQLIAMFKKNEVAIFPAANRDEVKIGFMINARNELIVLDVSGDNPSACRYVKEVINYQKVRFEQSRQLTRYSIKVFLTKVDR